MKVIGIEYVFTMEDGRQEFFELRIGEDSLELLNRPPESLPDWTRLEFEQCPCCPLSPSDCPHCPLAVRLSGVVQRFQGILSYDRVQVEVRTPERSYTVRTSAQRGISSLMGLISAVSGCPVTARFRPMARFHLPVATEEETLYRAFSMYSLAQFFVTRAGKQVDPGFEGLRRIYEDVHTLNVALMRRIGAVTQTDSPLNAIVCLDIYARAVPLAIDDTLAGIREWFDALAAPATG